MKKRVRIDSLILCSIIVGTGVLYSLSKIYSKSVFSDNIFDFIGFLVMLCGIYLRMAARGYKKKFSQEGHGLVTDGLYSFVRNPMYLGSFLMGMGFLLILWPWWALPFFAIAFYFRFNKQIVKEETHLESSFGDDYKKYCKKTPRIFPTIKSIQHLNLPKTFPLDVVWSTKEKRGLFLWPVLGIILETFQQQVVFGKMNLGQTVMIVAFSAAFFAVSLRFLYGDVKR